MRIVIILAFLAGPATADPAPSIKIDKRNCTTEPTPTTRLKKLPGAAKHARVELLGPPEWCITTWSVERDAGKLALVPSKVDMQPPCGTCWMQLRIGPVPAGDYEVSVPGAKVTVRAL